MAYATKNDVIVLYRELTEAEEAKIESYLEMAESMIMQEAIKANKDLETMIDEGILLEDTVKLVEVDVVRRCFLNNDDSYVNMSQFSESVAGYTFSGTPNRSGCYLLEREKARLGLKRQKVGIISL